MPFSNSIKEEALVRSRRCCCVCHEFAGLYINVHHIVKESDGGSNNLDNAIVLCLRCHGEAGHYNVRHPIGKKYSPTELRRHRDEWWKWCETNTAVPLPKHPISVSPGVIYLGAGNWRAHSPFRVHNRTDKIYYQVFIKIFVDVEEILTRDIDIKLAKPKVEHIMDAGDIDVCADIFRIDGMDQARKKAIYIWLGCLNPGEVYTFILINNSPYTSSIASQPKAFIAVLDFDREPASTLVQQGKAAISFKAPENIKLESISLLLKRAHRKA